MCRSYGDQFDSLLKDKDDIAIYLKKQLELRNSQVFDVNDRLVGLQQAKDRQKELLDESLDHCREKARLDIETLEHENLSLRKARHTI
jgi:hypothetical protein